MRIDPNSRIFISSTITDLRPFREAARLALKKTTTNAVLLEREWGPLGNKQRTETTVRKVRKEVCRASAIIAILGKRMGGAVRGTQFSFVEHELLTAQQQGIPVLVYVTPESKFFSRLLLGQESEFDLSVLFRAELVEAVQSPEELKSKLRRDIKSRIDFEVTSRKEIIVRSIDPIYWSTLASNPSELQNCSPRFFEELVAELLKADGWDVELILRSNAPGPDIIAVSTKLIKSKPVNLIVECKKYREDRPVGVAAVRNLVYWVNEEYKATYGMIVTTSTFTKAASALARDIHRWRISLTDQKDLISWLRRGSKT